MIEFVNLLMWLLFPEEEAHVKWTATCVLSCSDGLLGLAPSGVHLGKPLVDRFDRVGDFRFWLGDWLLTVLAFGC